MGWDYFLVGKLHSGYQLINHASGLRKGLELKISAQVLICQILVLRHVVPTIAEREGNKKNTRPLRNLRRAWIFYFLL